MQTQSLMLVQQVILPMGPSLQPPPFQGKDEQERNNSPGPSLWNFSDQSEKEDALKY